jgi:hypothetical protein
VEHSAGKGVDPALMPGVCLPGWAQSMLFFVLAACCWGNLWGTKPGPMRY